MTGTKLAQQLRVLGYEATRTTDSHQRLRTARNGVHHIAIPVSNYPVNLL